ncbi:MAG: hypothetical protein R2706_08940 [Acidimicrobiales bacterium]
MSPPKTKKERTDLIEIKQREFRDDELVTEVKALAAEAIARWRTQGRTRRRSPRRTQGRTRRRSLANAKADAATTPSYPAARDRAAAKAKRLRAGNKHRQAVLAEVPEEFRPIAEQVSRGGLPAVRAAIEKQNAELVASGGQPIKADPIIAIAEGLVPKLRTAEWHDRADAALNDLDQLDLRGSSLRVERRRERRPRRCVEEIVAKLQAGLNERIERDHQQWLTDLTEAMQQGRTVRALRLSSRPVKPGAPLPSELASEMAEAASAALAADVAQDRWATVLDAVAFSPIRVAVVPVGHPAEPGKDLLDAVRRVADRVPAIAALFGVDPAEAAKRRRPRRGRPEKGGAKGAAKASDKPKGDSPKPAAAEAPVADAPVPDAIEAAPQPDAIEAAPVPDAIEAAPVPDAIEAAPQPDAIEAAPVPDAIEAAPQLDAIEAAPDAVVDTEPAPSPTRWSQPSKSPTVWRCLSNTTSTTTLQSSQSIGPKRVTPSMAR